MVEHSVQRRGELMRGVFAVLEPYPDGLPARDVLAATEKIVPPTPYEDAMYPKHPTVRRRDKVVRFASIPFVKAGWLRKDNGIWRTTEEGLEAYVKYSDPVDFVHEAIRLYREWKKAQPDPDGDPDDVEDGPTAASILEEAQEASWSEIGDYLEVMNPYDFQDLVAALLKAMGYHVSWTSPKGRDGGLDVIAFTDPLGANGPRIKVQVKRRLDKVTVDDMRGFMSLLGPQDVGIYVSTGGFTSEASREARYQESRRLTLIDRNHLFELWVEHYEQVPELERSLLPLRPVYFLDPRD